MQRLLCIALCKVTFAFTYFRVLALLTGVEDNLLEHNGYPVMCSMWSIRVNIRTTYQVGRVTTNSDYTKRLFTVSTIFILRRKSVGKRLSILSVNLFSLLRNPFIHMSQLIRIRFSGRCHSCPLILQMTRVLSFHITCIMYINTKPTVTD